MTLFLSIIIIGLILIVGFLSSKKGNSIFITNSVKSSVDLIKDSMDTKLSDEFWGYYMYGMDVTQEMRKEYKFNLSKLDDLKKNIEEFNKIESQVQNVYNQYFEPYFSTNWTQCDIKEFGIENINYIFGSNVMSCLSPFQKKVQDEFSRCNLKLYGQPLRLISTDRFHLLINDWGFIYVDLEDPFQNDKIYRCTLTIPVEYLDHLEIDYSNTKFELILNTKYFRRVFERLNDVCEFEKLVVKMVNFNNMSFSKKINLESFQYQVIKENVKISLDDLIKLMIETKTISLNEYLINVELGRLEFDVEVFLDIIFNKQYLGSFHSKRKNKLKITKTSLGLLSIEELINYYKSGFKEKDDLYENFELSSFLKNIRIKKLHNLEFYKKCFDYHVLRDNENEEIPYLKTILSHRFFYDVNEKERFLKRELFRNLDDFDLVGLIESNIRKVENIIRIEKGYKIVGTFTNENILFQKLQKYFSDYKVVSQGRPKWLGKQSLDVFFPDFNIGVEYQGEQHYRPIDYFGGIEKFEIQQRLDNKKRELCGLNSCTLFEVREGYDFNGLVNTIESVITSKQSS